MTHHIPKGTEDMINQKDDDDDEPASGRPYSGVDFKKVRILFFSLIRVYYAAMSCDFRHFF